MKALRTTSAPDSARLLAPFAALLACAALLLGSCASKGGQQHLVEETQWINALQLPQTEQCADIAIEPIVNCTPTTTASTVVLREALAQALVQRRYSPLAAAYVDARAREASSAEAPPDARLEVVVDRWDERLLAQQGSLFVGATVRLRPGEGEGELWSASLVRRLELGPLANLPRTRAGVCDKAMAQFAPYVAELLPVRSAPGD
jgi:hypothetical protein